MEPNSRWIQLRSCCFTCHPISTGNQLILNWLRPAILVTAVEFQHRTTPWDFSGVGQSWIGEQQQCRLYGFSRDDVVHHVPCIGMPRPSGISHDIIDRSSLQGVTVSRMYSPRVYCQPACLYKKYQRLELLQWRSGKDMMVCDHEVHSKLKQYDILRARRRGRAARTRKQHYQTLAVDASSSVHTDIRSFVAPHSIDSRMDYAIPVRVTPAGCHLRYQVKSERFVDSRLHTLCNVPIEIDIYQMPVLLLTNIYHINNKTDDLSAVTDQVEPDIICICENLIKFADT